MAALIVDIFATEIIPVGLELGIKSYVFYSSSGIALSMFLHLPETTLLIDEWAPDKTLRFPGCPVLQVKDLPDPIHERSSAYYKWFIDHCNRFQLADAVVLNSFLALEEEPIRALTMGPTGTSKPPVYVVGPLVRISSNNNGVENEDDPSGCLRWLDEQPLESVLYVSFGSGGTLSTAQVTELAWGLELSEQRFLWVVRSPNDSVSFGTYLSLDETMDPLGFLPKGFLERTKGRGLVVQSWAPQVKILGHVSTGGFITHCGWNSVLEGSANGVGFIAWPLYAEQHMNAIELVDKVGVALRVEKKKDGVVGRDEIAKVVKAFMKGEEGRKIREKMKAIKDEAYRTMSHDGLSNLALSKLAHMCNN